MIIKRALYPGTFDPVHCGHINIIDRAAALFDELVVGVYDHGKPLKSVFFSVEDRVALIQEALDGRENVSVRPYSMLTVDFAKEIQAQAIVRGLRVFSDFEFEFRMALANQRLVPDMETISLMTREEHMFLSSTTVREIASMGGDVSSMVPENVVQSLADLFNSDRAHELTATTSLRD